jgi:glucose/arabinose dehydrogenase
MKLLRLRLAVVAVLSSGVAASAQAANLPPGFVEQVVVKGLAGPMSMYWAPDNHLWIGGQLGDIWVAHLENPAEAELTYITRLPVSFLGERGVIGLAIDPDFVENHYVWIFRTTTERPARNRLSRFRNVGDQLVEETVILETPDLMNIVHNGGCLRFASDGTLFLSTGDDLQGSDTSQNTHDLRGKILHIRRDGSPAPGNPFSDGIEGDPRVWAYGLRNPWRFHLQPGSENLFIGDVGGDFYEEIDLGFPGANFGWRLTEGPEPPGVPGVSYPIYSYPHTSELGHAVVAGQHAPALNFPEDFEGDFFFADQVTREIFRMVLDESNRPSLVEVFASDLAEGPVDLQFGPDGSLYYLGFNGALYRIAHVGGFNRQPVAQATVEPDNGDAPLDVALDASGSFDPEGAALHYHWDLGDGQTSEQPTLRKTYPAGEYFVTLTVSDPLGLSNEVRDIRIVSGSHRPEAVIQRPGKDRRYREGELITFSGEGIDPEEGLLPCKGLSWRVIFHHRGHTHPFLGPLQGICEGSFVIESHGEVETFFEIQLTAEDRGEPLGDSGKLAGMRSVFIYPLEGSR